MPRLRALLALLLAATWCAAVLHAELEAIGLMLAHEHHAHGDAHHAPGDVTEHHDEVIARNVAKDDQLRPATGGAWLAVVMLVAIGALTGSRRSAADAAISLCGEGDPPGARIWQFVQRCAPESAAPPALG